MENRYKLGLTAVVLVLALASVSRVSATSGSDLAGWNQTDECSSGPCNWSLLNYGSYSLVLANPSYSANTYLNVIAYDKLYTDWRSLSTVTYQIQVQTPSDNFNPHYGDEGTAQSVQLWDGSVKVSYEFTVGFCANPWNPYYGWLGYYSTGGYHQLKHVGGFDRFHTVKIAVHVQSKTFDIYWDGSLMASGLSSFNVNHPNWGTDFSAAVTAEATNLYPGQGQPTEGWAYYQNWSWSLS
jgi:hypothetical protein